MKSKRWLTGILLAGSVMSLCSCGSSSDGRIKIKVGFYPDKSEKKDVAMYEEWVKAFETDHPEYQIVADPYIYSPDTVAARGRAETLPTIFQTWFTEPASLVESKYIRECGKQLENLGWLSKMNPEMKQTVTFDEKVYGVPRDGYGLGLLINKKILGDNDLLPMIDGKYSIYNEDGSPAYPTTFEEIHQAALQIVENDEAKGFMIMTANKNGGWQFTNMAWNFGAVIEKKDEATGKWTADLTSQGCLDALNWIKTMCVDECLPVSATVYYDDWSSKIGSQVAMAFVGNDVLQNAQRDGVDMSDLAFVPMPTGDGIHRYSLYGGTPYVFASNATDEQVEGALKFLEYIGRSPETSTIAREAILKGNEVAVSKSQPILPTIKPWINEDYLKMANEIEKDFISVDMTDFHEFYDTIETIKHAEEPYYAQNLYKILDGCIQSIISNKENSNPLSLLQTAEASFNRDYMSKVK